MSKALERVFSTPGVNPFDEVKWERRTAAITDDRGKVIFNQENVEVPEFWSLLATKVVVSKYFYGEQGTSERETSVRQLIHRVCRTIADWGVQDGYLAKEDGEVFYNELAYLSVNQYGAFNSPVWFNVGLHHQYGVGKNSTRGNWVYNPKTRQCERPPTQYDHPQCSACFIQSVDDNMESIMNLATSEAMLFKFGSGTGTDLTPLRSKREKLSGGGRPSGPLSFLQVYDQVAGIVKSGGKTRRAAKMNTIRDWHGDIEEFIECKSHEEKKAHALIAQGYDSSFNGEAYGSIKFQNENLSVRVSDEFMQAAVDGKEWWTRAVTTGQPLEKKNAADLLRKIALGTWTCGDPGLQYDGPIQKWHTCKGTEAIHSTNPCSEYVFLNNTACNLASLNLMKFKKADGGFDRSVSAPRFESTSPPRRSWWTTPAIRFEDRRELPRLPDPGPGLRKPGIARHELRPPLRFGRSPRPDRRHHLHHDRRSLRPIGPDGPVKGPFKGYRTPAAPASKRPRPRTMWTPCSHVIEQHRSEVDKISAIPMVEDLHPSGPRLLGRALWSWASNTATATPR